MTTSEGTIKQSDLPRFKLGEMGSSGLKVTEGVIYEEYKSDLIWPHNIRTYKNMSLDPVVDSALKVIMAYIKTVEFKVEPPKNATPEQIQRAEFIESCMHDMDRSFSDYIQEALSYLIYGFNVAEKVFKRRSTTSPYKSKFTDNLIGWESLPTRSQDTIDKWYFDEEGRKLLGCRQNLNLIRQGVFFSNSLKDKERLLPRAKFLLFRSDPFRDNPQGNSPLNGAYIPWRYKTTLEETQAVGASRDLRGIPVLRIPAQYMSPDASAEEKAFYESAKRIVRNLENNEQAGVVLPLVYDNNGNELFKFELLGLSGGRGSDTDEIIKRYENKILMAFMADVLKTGHDGSGSFALADSKTNLLAVGIQSRLIEILSVFNEDLIPHTFALNGWKDVVYPKIVFGDLDEISLDEVGKFIQRVASVGALEVDKPLSDALRQRVGADPADITKKLDEELVNGGTSRAGDGMKEGMPSGTGKSNKNNSATNSNNSE